MLAGDRRALPEHGPEWVDAICADGRYADASRLYLLTDGRQYVLPLVARRGPLGVGGALAGFPPAWGIGGLVGADADPTVARAVLTDLRSIGAQRIGIRPDPMRWSAWAEAVDRTMITIARRAHVIDLSGGRDAAFAKLSKSARRGTRAAEKAGVRVEIDRTGVLLDDYYGLYLLSVDRWARHQHEPRRLARLRASRRDPRAKLAAMADRLGKSFVVTIAYLDDRPAFGSITVLGQTAHDIRSAMDRDLVAGTYAGDLVQWRTMELACDEGCSAYHLGESGRSTSLAAFKEKFGAEAIDYAEIRLERAPWTRTDQAVRGLAKRVLGFRDA